MTDKPMIDSEAVTAGAVRQSSEGEAIAYVVQIRGLVQERNELARQLAQAQERVARETSEIINAVRALPGELQGQGTLADAIRVLVAHNAQLRRVVEQVEWVEPPDAHPGLGRWCPTCRAWESDGHEVHCPYYGGQVNGILADAPDNPYTAVIEAADELYGALANLPGQKEGAS